MSTAALTHFRMITQGIPELYEQINEADFQLKAVTELCADKELAQSLCKNPFMTHEEIVEYYKKNIIKYLDFEFEEYCTCDDYYQPVVEDFDVEYYVREWCKKNKFIVMSCEGNGYDNGYEPSFRCF